MTLIQYLITHYPNADPMRDFQVADAGSGQYISRWNGTTPRPTRAELAAAGIIEGRITMSAMQDFQTKTTAQMANARAIIIATRETDLISLGGGIPTLISDTAAGQPVGDSTWTKERAQEVSALWAAFNAWLSMPLTDAAAHGKPPIAILTAYDD